MVAVSIPDPERLCSTVRQIRGRRVVVLGAGRSGLAAGRLLHRRGAEVSVVDDKPADALEALHAELRDEGITLVAGGIQADSFLDAELAVISPGVPLSRPEVASAAKQGVLLAGEIDVALALADRPTVAITGTNGKSTTTTMVGSLLDAGGLRPFVGGNLGRPLCEAVDEVDLYGSFVVELSSYQLEIVSLLRPLVAIITNLSPDHLDRYPDADAYYAAKRRVFERMASGGVVVARQRDLDLGLLVPSERDTWLTYGKEIPGDGARVLSDAIEAVRRGDEERFTVANPRIRGAHNRENLAAAVLAALACGVDPDGVRQGISRYPGIPHRLETVTSVGDVLYVNDSKGTNVDATVKAITSFESPVLLIAGGRGKGTGYAPLVEAARGRVRVLLTIGEAGPEIASALSGVVDEVLESGTLDCAVAEAARRAQPGETVLLSPACASFDQFTNFEERGRAFSRAVRGVEKSR